MCPAASSGTSRYLACGRQLRNMTTSVKSSIRTERSCCAFMNGVRRPSLLDEPRSRAAGKRPPVVFPGRRIRPGAAKGTHPRRSPRRRVPREPEHWNSRVFTPRSRWVLRHGQCALCGLTRRLLHGCRIHPSLRHQSCLEAKGRHFPTLEDSQALNHQLVRKVKTMRQEADGDA